MSFMKYAWETGRMAMAWKIWLGVAITLTTIYFVVEKSATSKLVLYNGLGLMSIVLLLVGVKINKPDTLKPWLWFAGGLTSFLTADVIYYVIELRAGEAGPPFPNVADAFYLGMYPLMIVGLIKLGSDPNDTDDVPDQDAFEPIE